MTLDKIYNELETTFEKEYAKTESMIMCSPWWLTDKREAVNNAIHYCLGIAQFAQSLGLMYEDVDPLYNKYFEKFRFLLDNYC